MLDGWGHLLVSDHCSDQPNPFFWMPFQDDDMPLFLKIFFTKQYHLFFNYSASLQLVDNMLIFVIHEL